MITTNNDRDIALEKLRSAAISNKLVIIVGSGVSRALAANSGALSWISLIESGFKYALEKGRISQIQLDNWKSHLISSDLDDLLTAAEFVGRKLGAPEDPLYARWLERCFSNCKAEEANLASTIRTLADFGIPIATLNYDTLLESITAQPSIRVSENNKVAAWMRREAKGILHLHGIWDSPESCVLGIRDYQNTLTSDVRDLLQRALGAFGQLLFIGCGDTFADPNFSRLLQWLKLEMKAAAPMHYALVRDDDVTPRHSDKTWQGFVEPLGYGADHSGLGPVLLSLLPTGGNTSKRSKARKPSSTPITQQVLDNYREFLIRDCGTMTIEGVKADMDTAQRRFELERLFVPLKTSPTPPEFSPTDPEREEKIQNWMERNGVPIAFGKALTKSKKIALLALPGGGKTILLKRIAVAYADPSRLTKSDDSLPRIDAYPVLIRCREWRDQITRPIPTILANMASITGHSELSGFYEACLPLLKSGKLLLLVDGLDEIHDDADRTIFVENLEKFLDLFPKIRMVVTSREAGFNLVAPTLSRFCDKWRVAPLEDDAIENLCTYWQNLMVADTPEAIKEAKDTSKRLIHTPALRRLAENPLLLTMLLVVKHGAGRLPPDRVNLYGRAVDVLLDTWNIKGHDALNVKEAVPQLAYVAFELMRRGRQTATEQELISLLEEARDNVPQIRRYAKDSPYDFLKRVELRSSLLVEAGHQKEGSKTVPFYQFRHLTFQEYLAAVAAVEGHYKGYSSASTIMFPLGPHLNAEEWKEVIPMAAVLARKQAEPLLISLTESVQIEMDQIRMQLPLDPEGKTRGHDLIGSPALLLQCLAEEAEASPSTLERALKQLAAFARGTRSSPNWSALLAGPYGSEFRHQAWSLFESDWPRDPWLRNTVAVTLSQDSKYAWNDSEIVATLLDGLNSDEVTCRQTLMSIAGKYWGHSGDYEIPQAFPIEILEKYAIFRNAEVSEPAIWAIGLINSRNQKYVPSTILLDILVENYLNSDEYSSISDFTLGAFLGMRREYWRPKLNDDQRKLVGGSLGKHDESRAPIEGRANLVIAFHSKAVPDSELAKHMKSIKGQRSRIGAEAALAQLSI